jgi:hypothetical protein
MVAFEWKAVLVFGGLALFFCFFLRGMIVGLLDVLKVPRRQMNVTIENNGLGVLLGEERWYLFLDGVTRISEYVEGLLTIEHWNGSVVHIPKQLISAAQLAHIHDRMNHGGTDVGFKETVERGKLIEALTQNTSQR